MQHDPLHSTSGLIPAEVTIGCANACLVSRRHRAKENSHEESDSRGPRRLAGTGHPSKGRLHDAGASKATSADEVVAVTYEHLATAIIEIEATQRR